MAVALAERHARGAAVQDLAVRPQHARDARQAAGDAGRAEARIERGEMGVAVQHRHDGRLRPDRRRDRRHGRVEVVGLAGQDHDVVGAALVAPRHHLDRHDGIALGALHHQAVAAHQLGALLAQQEGDVDAGLGQARAPVAADGAGAQNQDLHFWTFLSAIHSASQVARSSVSWWMWLRSRSAGALHALVGADPHRAHAHVAGGLEVDRRCRRPCRRASDRRRA